MTLPMPTVDLLTRLRRAAVLLDSVAANAKGELAYTTAHDAANTCWLAITRLEDLAMVLEDLELTPGDEDDTERHAKDLNAQ